MMKILITGATSGIGYNLAKELIKRRHIVYITVHHNKEIKLVRRKLKKDNILKHYDRVLILDGVQDPGNLGTILRSALAFGFKQIVMSPDCVDLYNDKALRSTQGAVFHLDIVRDELSHVIPELQKLGVRVIATSLHNASSIDDIKSTDKMAFVMGNEGNGVRDETIAMSDASLYIPIDTMESLNVGVAAGIVMYTFKGVHYD